MANADDGKVFRVEIVRGSEPQFSQQLVMVSLAANMKSLEAELLPADLWRPELAPSLSLQKQYAENRVDWHELCRRYSLELDPLASECEELRALACCPGIALLIQDGQLHQDVAAAMKRHLQQLECKRRWNDGLMIGGYVYPLRREIRAAGGMWFAQHKAWMMPDRATWRYIHSLLPGDF